MLFAAWLTPAIAQSPCEIPSADSYGVVEHVYDGDTVRLRDGRHVRLIGIDAPEIGRNGRPSEPHARQSRETLQRLLDASRDVWLVTGVEARDGHGRLLAHLGLRDGRNLQQALLEQGMAVVLAVPPNTPLVHCYLPADRRARGQRLGVWRDASRGPLDAANLARTASGFRLVRGRVHTLRETRSSLWLEMGPRFSARIARKDIERFDRVALDALVGRTVIVRGYLFGDREQRHLTVRHPALIEAVH